MKIPVYNIIIDLNDEESGMTAISLVEDPAVERDFICFNKDQKPMQFKVEDELEHKVTGVAIWANKEIYRYDPTFGEYYVVFTPETIDQIVHKYAKQGLNNLVDLQHDGEMISGVTMVEYYIKDTKKGINPAGFEDVDDGSLFVTYKIEDDKLWQEIISPDSEFKGFSIEIYADIVPTDEYVEVEEDESELNDEEFMNWLDELLKALEEADCEVLMESDKKKDKFEDDDEEDGFWHLNFEIERSDVARAIDQKKAVLVDGKELWIHSLGKDNDKDVLIAYNPKTSKWIERVIKDIKEFEPTKTSVGEFPEVPSSITSNDDITIQRTINTGTYSDLIHNRVPVMISYDDEQPNPHTGYRQCCIIAWGQTKKQNECIRVMELYGDSRSAAEGENYIPNYRLLLTRRCKAFKPMQGVQPWSIDVLDSRTNWNGDRSMEPCYDHIKTEDFD